MAAHRVDVSVRSPTNCTAAVGREKKKDRKDKTAAIYLQTGILHTRVLLRDQNGSSERQGQKGGGKKVETVQSQTECFLLRSQTESQFVQGLALVRPKS